ncbi:MAG: hypothetical protein ACFB4J_03195 [Elainellaceae cyanobacterium]
MMYSHLRNSATDATAHAEDLSSRQRIPSEIERAAFILRLSRLKLSSNGTWQAQDRYGNQLTVTPRLVRATLYGVVENLGLATSLGAVL